MPPSTHLGLIPSITVSELEIIKCPGYGWVGRKAPPVSSIA